MGLHCFLIIIHIIFPFDFFRIRVYYLYWKHNLTLRLTMPAEETLATPPKSARRIDMGELFIALSEERKKGQPLALYCLKRGVTSNEKKDMEDKILLALRRLHHAPSFSLLFRDPIPNGRTLYTGITRSGEASFFSSP